MQTRSLHITAPDGLRLHALTAGFADSGRLPVVCLPGLARTAEDFRELMFALAGEPSGRRALALDSRGRGGSERDRNPQNYSVPVELLDLLAVLDATGIGRAIFVGTSRGGLLIMALAVARPRAIAGAVLNDIGPVIEMAGLLRIKSYVGKLPTPRSWPEAASLLRSALGGQFPSLDEDAWLRFAERTWTANDGAFAIRYDPALAETLAALDPSEPLPALWPQFDALGHVPVLLVRGEHSDILSRETAAAMQTRHPDLRLMEIAGQGHAPLLTDAPTIGAIAQFAARCDG